MRPGVVTAGEAQPSQHIQGLLPDRLDSLDDRARIGLSMLERALEIVDHRQPFPGHLSPGLSLGVPHLDGTPLAQVIQVGEGPQPQVLGLGEPGLQLGQGAPAALTVRRCRLGSRILLGLRQLAAARPGLGPSGSFTHGR